MKCWICHKPLTAADAARRAEYRQQGGVEKVFGRGMPDGELAKASGQLVKVAHNSCYHAARKRAQRSAR